eukprot:CAMPEP_0182476266 /NCGR_PEP_ID=MMETSP1319-20130603/28741_1 /TAXON_ID=172717 /ORGANISM="Bolidomonas pacifica, Strain RCC208" /LENGTH=240 /DNA_ID=CAMNT_0024677337 /DNA_START=224 /DNA_END=943 /DNA_ORIENTATION=+
MDLSKSTNNQLQNHPGGLKLPNFFTDPFYNPPDSKTTKSQTKSKSPASTKAKKDKVSTPSASVKNDDNNSKKDDNAASLDPTSGDSSSALPVSVAYYAALSTTLTSLISECQTRLASLEDLYYNESSTPFSIHLGAPSGSSAVTVTQHNGCWGGGGVWGGWAGFADVKVPGGQDVIELVHTSAPPSAAALKRPERGPSDAENKADAEASPPARVPRWSAGDYMSGGGGSTVYCVKSLAHS